MPSVLSRALEIIQTLTTDELLQVEQAVQNRLQQEKRRSSLDTPRAP